MSIKDELEALHGSAKDMVTQIENLARSVGLDLKTTNGEGLSIELQYPTDVYDSVNVYDAYETATDYLFRRFSGGEEIAVPLLRNLKRKALQISREIGGPSRIEDDKGTSYFHKEVLSKAFYEVFFGPLNG